MSKNKLKKNKSSNKLSKPVVSENTDNKKVDVKVKKKLVKIDSNKDSKRILVGDLVVTKNTKLHTVMQVYLKNGSKKEAAKALYDFVKAEKKVTKNTSYKTYTEKDAFKRAAAIFVYLAGKGVFPEKSKKVKAA